MAREERQIDRKSFKDSRSSGGRDYDLRGEKQVGRRCCHLFGGRNTGENSNSISVIGIIGPPSNRRTHSRCTGHVHCPSRHFPSTFYPALSHEGEREREGEKDWPRTGYGKLSFRCAPHTGHAKLLPSRVARATTILHQIRDPGRAPSR